MFWLSFCSDHWSNLVPRLQLQGLLPVSLFEYFQAMSNLECNGSFPNAFKHAYYTCPILTYTHILQTHTIIIK